jgi:hypothetical protein
MQHRSTRARTPRHVAWLLWLALLLPFAQAAANWHGLSHVRVDASAADPDGKQTLHAAHCDLCLVAAAVTGGAPASDTPTIVLRAAVHEAPMRAHHGLVSAAPTLAYLSRAPPSVLL